MKLILPIGLFVSLLTSANAQKTEALTLIGSYSASNGGFIFSNAKGDTLFNCPTHPDSYLVKKKLHSLYSADTGGPELNPKFANKKYQVTYFLTDSTLSNNGSGPGVTATVTKMVLVK